VPNVSMKIKISDRLMRELLSKFCSLLVAAAVCHFWHWPGHISLMIVNLRSNNLNRNASSVTTMHDERIYGTINIGYRGKPAF
jgi:hypothetical protein